MILPRTQIPQTFGGKQRDSLLAVLLSWPPGILPGSQLVYNRPDLLAKAPEASTDHTA